MKKLSVFLVMLVALTGCKDENQEVQTVEWYKTHEVERKAMVTTCEDNPGELAITPNCVNAKAADSATIHGSQNYRIDAAPLTFKRK
jgi:hypothetical protein